MNLEQEKALLEATVREFLRIAEAAETEKSCVAFEDALDGRLRDEWVSIRRKAKYLLESLS